MHFNPFLTNGLIHPRLDEFISSFKVSGGCFHFYCYFHRNFCKQVV